MLPTVEPVGYFRRSLRDQTLAKLQSTLKGCGNFGSSLTIQMNTPAPFQGANAANAPTQGGARRGGGLALG